VQQSCTNIRERVSSAPGFADRAEVESALNEVSPRQIVAELEADHRRELLKLSDLAFIFLDAAGGDVAEAEALLDDFIDLVLDGGTLSLWRYRILLARVREGL
jgi:hypothetical protein